MDPHSPHGSAIARNHHGSPGLGCRRCCRRSSVQDRRAPAARASDALSSPGPAEAESLALNLGRPQSGGIPNVGDLRRFLLLVTSLVQRQSVSASRLAFQQADKCLVAPITGP
eukprot:10808013-Heterocapsa_arctica.AAC.1